MMKRKITIVGAFDFVGMATGGQPVKTRELYWAFRDLYGKDCVEAVETLGWQKSPWTMLSLFFRSAKNSRSIVMLPAHKGVRVFSILCMVAKILFGCRLYYDVIGGWLATDLEHHQFTRYCLKRFDGIWVETSSMAEDMKNLGFNNIQILYNFKTLKPLEPEMLAAESAYPLRLCFFARVMREKGIEDAINAVKAINEAAETVVYELDIYGPIDEAYAAQFRELQTVFPGYVRYMGVAKPSESVEIIRPYTALIFPTRFFTEGIPGTIIDAYCAGVPVVAPRWRNYSDVVKENTTGLLYEFGNYKELKALLQIAAENPDRLNSMKKECLKMSHQFTTGYAKGQLKSLIEN